MSAIALMKYFQQTGKDLPTPMKLIMEKRLVLEEKKEAAQIADIRQRQVAQAQETLPGVVAKSLFPWAAPFFPHPAIKKGVKAIPQAFAEAVFPPASLFTGQLPAETMAKAGLEDQLRYAPIPASEKEKIRERFETFYQESKPFVFGGGTTIFEAADISMPVISMPEMKFPDLSGIGKYALIAIAALGGLYILGKSMGRK